MDFANNGIWILLTNFLNNGSDYGNQFPTAGHSGFAPGG
jgi:hypothetical protein